MDVDKEAYLKLVANTVLHCAKADKELISRMNMAFNEVQGSISQDSKSEAVTLTFNNESDRARYITALGKTGVRVVYGPA